MKRMTIRGFAVAFPVIAMMMLILMLLMDHESFFDRFPDDNSFVKGDNIAKADSLFSFDPNTAAYEDLRRLGFSQMAAAAVIRRQRSGWTFAVEEEVAAVYGVDDSLYYRLKPYIVIGEEFRPKRSDGSRKGCNSRERRERVIRYEPFRIDTATVSYLSTIGFSVRQARVIVDYRDRIGGFYSLEDFASCFVVDDDICDTLSHYIIFPEREAAAVRGPVDINTADSAALRSVYGIGGKSAVAILKYRERLGGFVGVHQLAEVKEVTESNFEKILPQICCDSCNISKIDINFASPERLKGHPYIGPKKLRKLLNRRQLKGGWSKIEEMIEDEIFDEREAERLRPYLRFTEAER